MAKTPLTQAELIEILSQNKPIVDRIMTGPMFVHKRNFKTEGPISISINNTEFEHLDIRDTVIDRFSIQNTKGDRFEFGVEGELNHFTCSHNTKITHLSLVSPTDSKASIKQLQIEESTFNILGVSNLDIRHNYVVNKSTIENFHVNAENRTRSVNRIMFLDGSCLNVAMSNLNVEDCLFRGTNSKSNFDVQRCKIGKFKLKKFDPLSLSLNNSECRQLSFEESSIDNLNFSGQGNYETLTHSEAEPNKMNCKELIIDGLVLRNILMFNNFKFRTIVFRWFFNTGNFRFNNCEVAEYFIIYASSMGRTILNNVTIPKGKFHIIDANIEEMEFYNHDWHGDFSINENWNKDLPVTKEHFKISLREAYRQLKNGYAKHGNKIEALEFQRKELCHHYYVTKNKTFSVSPWYSFFEHLGNYLILATHKWSSSFGLNVLRPLAYLLLAHLILFNIMIYTHPDFEYKASPLDWHCESTLLGIGDFLQTLLPTHGIIIQHGLEKKINISGITDVFMRLFSAYFIFYFISASRKYHQS